jgi:hypothetical protein
MRRSLVTIALLAAVCAGCSSSSSGGTTPQTPATTPAGSPTEQITANWIAFFNYQTPAATRLSLLEDGSTLQQAMALGDRFAKQQKLQETATVAKVKLIDATHAEVTYTINNRGSAFFSDATGNAILVDGEWKVAKASFCTLIQLGAGGKPVPGCV